MSVLTFTIFAIVFGIILDQMEHINRIINRFVNFGNYRQNNLGDRENIESLTFDECITENCVYWCYTKVEYQSDEYQQLSKEEWTRRHIMDSWDQFWSASLICFILGAYAIAGSVYAYNTSEEITKEKIT